MYDDLADAVRADVKFGQGYLSAAYGKMSNNVVYGAETNESVADDYWSAALGGRWGNLHAEATYTKINDQDFGTMCGDPGTARFDNKIWTVGADYTAGKWNVNAMYLKGDAMPMAWKTMWMMAVMYSVWVMPVPMPRNQAPGACMPNTMIRLP